MIEKIMYLYRKYRDEIIFGKLLENLLDMKNHQKIGGFHFAERTRFELVVRVTPHAGLANRWYKPLTHLSGPAYTP